LGILLAALALRDVRSLGPVKGASFWLWSVPTLGLPIAVALLGDVRAAGPVLLGLWCLGAVGVVAALRRAELGRGALCVQPLLTLFVGAGFGAMIQLGSRIGIEHLLAAVLLLQAQDSFAYLGGRRSVPRQESLRQRSRWQSSRHESRNRTLRRPSIASLLRASRLSQQAQPPDPRDGLDLVERGWVNRRCQ
jgi:hypothetical protein